MDGSVTRWLDPLRDGDPEASRQLWERFFTRLVGLARRRLGPARQAQTSDEEDVALSAFASFCQRAQDGQFDALSDRDELWRLLATITARKAIDRARRARTAKRGGDATALPLEDVPTGEPTPEMVAEMAEQLHLLLARLDESTRPIALRRMEGYSVEEIAAEMNCSSRTIKRKLALIRDHWEVEQS